MIYNRNPEVTKNHGRSELIECRNQFHKYYNLKNS
jgi:hypothetical protein